MRVVCVHARLGEIDVNVTSLESGQFRLRREHADGTHGWKP